MAVVCAACGKSSQDVEFCDFCNAELAPTTAQLPPDRVPLAGAGVPLVETQRRALSRVEGWALVSDGRHAWRVHWIPQDALSAWQPRLERRLSLKLPSLAPGRLLPDGNGVWLCLEAGHPWTPWAGTVADPIEALAQVVAGSERVASALTELHRNGLVCVTFDPTALEEGPASLRFANLGPEVYPAGHLPERIGTHRGFTAPEVADYRPEDVGPCTDTFHLALFAYCWLAGLLPDGFGGSGPEVFHYEFPLLRVYTPALPEGVWSVLRRGLAVEPGRRQATPAALVAELRVALERACRRRAFIGAIDWDAACHTRAGRVKTALGKANEDQVLVRHFPDEGASLVAVADGISSCHVGSGALASLLTTFLVETVFAFGCSHDEFPQRAAQTGRQAAQSLLDWALNKGYKTQLSLGLDLMGTTLTLGWLQGRELSVANLGDSRAYLVTADDVEQLTVDGDLASCLLARRVPPEEVRELGLIARSLRECVGGCVVTADGSVRPMPESGHPGLGRWPLLPGDVIVLCTDGLVEEDFFLEPAALGELVRANRRRTAQELALLLADAADALQRPVSPQEPDGMGDNIGCVVIKIEEAAPGTPSPGSASRG